MAKKPYTNNTNRIQHVGTVTVFPGSTREVEETLIPDFKPQTQAEQEPSEDEVRAEILEHTLSELEDILPKMNNEELDALAKAEAEGKNRKGVLEQIQEIKLDRASENQE